MNHESGDASGATTRFVGHSQWDGMGVQAQGKSRVCVGGGMIISPFKIVREALAFRLFLSLYWFHALIDAVRILRA